jgi:hypothetical protein
MKTLGRGFVERAYKLEPEITSGMGQAEYAYLIQQNTKHLLKDGAFLHGPRDTQVCYLK